MTRRLRRWLLACVVLIAVLSCAVFYLTTARRGITRFYAFGEYGNAISYFYVKRLPVPDYREEIENVYNKYEGRHQDIPSPPYYLRPTFRPLTNLSQGPYLVFIETKPGGLQDWRRYVIYANADGSDVRVNNVTEWQLPSLIAKDDELRSKNTGATTQNVAPSP